MDTKLKKMTANIKGIKGWFVLTVLGLDVLLGIDGGNLISTFYGDVIIYVAFLATVTAGIMLTISLRPDSKEWPFFVIFDNFKTDTLFWLELLIVTCTMAAFAWIAGLYESWSWAYSAAVQEGLKESLIIEKFLCRRVRMSMDYTMLGKMQYLAAKLNLMILDTLYTEGVEMQLLVPDTQYAAFIKEVTEASNGKVVPESEGLCYGADVEGKIEIFDA